MVEPRFESVYIYGKKLANKLIKSAADLVTDRVDTRAGFIAMALEKNNRAVPFVEEAKVLRLLSNQIASPNDIPKTKEIRAGALTASGLSDKSLGYLSVEDQDAALLAMIEKFLLPAGKDWIDELVYRFLLIKGDTLGGQMRNVAGVLGARKFMRALISVLNLSGIEYFWGTKNGKWFKKPEEGQDFDIDKVFCLSWTFDGNSKLLLQNLNVPIVGKNVDLCLFNGSYKDVTDKESVKKLILDTSKYISLGELKGGIDPAGADEHWKTANSAIERIRVAFKAQEFTPSTFFVGAAIESAMANEIFDQLQKGVLTNAANLCNSDQLVEICKWIVE